MSGDAYRQRERDPHDVLRVPRGADRRQVIRAFHREARRGGHPDTGGDAQTFDDIIRARDALLDPPRVADADRRAAAAATEPNANPSPTYSSPREFNKLAIVMAVLALFGPLFWPVAIAMGHLALRQIKRTGQGGGTLVPVVMFFLYILTLPVLLLVLSVIVVP